MSVLIGHASIDENKNIKNGIAGDQSGKEVCKRTWYLSDWNYLLRCKDAYKAEKMAKTCEDACDNPYIGYDQNERNTLIKLARLNNYDLAKINIPCECDCSSLMAVCAESAGIKVYSSTNAPTTTSMKAVFGATGQFDILTDDKFLKTDKNLRRGDILVRQGHHTVMVLNSSNKSNNEENNFVIGMTYTLLSNLYIRGSAAGDKIDYLSLTTNAQLNAYVDSEGCSILRKGTRVTCKSIKKMNGQIWMQIPSGWVCAKDNNGKNYII